jgi:hypothetical protein
VTPQPNEVRRTLGGRTFVVLGDAGNGDDGSDMYRYREPHTTVMETTGRWIGAKFNVPTRDVVKWETISDPRGAVER